MDISNTKLFTREGKDITYQDLLSDIYTNNEESRDTIRLLMEQLVSLIDSPQSAAALMDHINSILNSKIRNDDLLLKLAAIVSRSTTKSMDSDGGELLISPDEKRQLLQEAEAYLKHHETNIDVTAPTISE